MKTYVRSCICN